MSDEPKRGHPYNANYEVVLTLKEGGPAVLAEACRWSQPKQVGDRVKMQLWEAMLVFGPHIVFGLDAPFEMTVELLGDACVSWDAMEARLAGHEAYRIEFVGDFLKVPADRRDACLRDFADSLATFGPIDELARGGEEAGSGKESTMPYWLWIDDGKRDITVNIGDER
jgi:hypothetical protein